MTFTPIARGTQNWDVPLNTALTQLDNNTSTVSGASLQRSNNLSDLTNVPQARTNLGLTGLANALSNLTATTNPTVSSDSTQGYSVGSTWVNTTTQNIFVCASAAVGAAVWSQIPVLPVPVNQGGTGSTTQNFVDLTTTQTVAGNKTYSGSPTFNGTTNTFTNGIAVSTAGKGISVKSGTNAKAGTVTANGATAVTVATTAATANSIVNLSYKSGTQATTGTAWVSGLTAGTSFAIKSIAGDTAVYNWVIIDLS